LPSNDDAGRIVTLDIIRGVAVMGIFSVNVIAFAMIEAAYFNPPAYGGHTGADLAVWAANMVFIDGKMRSLFSMLFGASMLLVIERAEAAGRSGLQVHLRPNARPARLRPRPLLLHLVRRHPRASTPSAG
jgi:uncharacterized protein